MSWISRLHHLLRQFGDRENVSKGQHSDDFVQLYVDRLEERRVLSVTAALADGVLTVTGDGDADAVEIRLIDAGEDGPGAGEEFIQIFNNGSMVNIEVMGSGPPPPSSMLVNQIATSQLHGNSGIEAGLQVDLGQGEDSLSLQIPTGVSFQNNQLSILVKDDAQEDSLTLVDNDLSMNEKLATNVFLKADASTIQFDDGTFQLGSVDLVLTGTLQLTTDQSLTMDGDLTINGDIGSDFSDSGMNRSLEINLPDLNMDMVSNEFTLNGSVGESDSRLSTFTVNAPEITLGGDAFTTGSQSLMGTLSLTGDVELNAGGDVNLGGILGAGNELTINSDTSVSLGADASGLSALTIEAVNSISLQNVTTQTIAGATGHQDYKATTVISNSSYITGGGNFSIDGEWDLNSSTSVTTSGGMIDLSSAIIFTSNGSGGPMMNPDVNLTLNSAGTTDGEIKLGSTRMPTVMPEELIDAVTITDAGSVTFSANPFAIKGALTQSAGSGTTKLDGTIGANGINITTMDINIASSADVNSLATIDLAANSIAISSDVEADGNVSLNSSMSAIIFSGTSAITANDGTGNITITGEVSGDNMDSAEITFNGTTSIDGDINGAAGSGIEQLNIEGGKLTVGNLEITGGIQVDDDSEVEVDGNDGVVIGGSATLGGNVATTFAGANIDISGSVSLTDSMTFSTSNGMVNIMGAGGVDGNAGVNLTFDSIANVSGAVGPTLQNLIVNGGKLTADSINITGGIQIEDGSEVQADGEDGIIIGGTARLGGNISTTNEFADIHIGETVTLTKSMVFSTFNGEVTITDGDVMGDGSPDIDVTFDSITNINGALGTSLRNLIVTDGKLTADSVNFSGGIQVDAGSDVEADDGDIIIGGGATLSGDLTTSKEFANIQIGGPVNLSDAMTFSTFNGGVTIESGDIDGEGNINIEGSATIAGSLTSAGIVTITDGLTLKRGATDRDIILTANQFDITGDIGVDTVNGGMSGDPKVNVFTNGMISASGTIGSNIDLLEVQTGSLSGGTIDLSGDLVVGAGSSAKSDTGIVRVFGETSLAGSLSAADGQTLTLTEKVTVTGTATLSGTNIEIEDNLVGGTSGMPKVTVFGNTNVGGIVGGAGNVLTLEVQMGTFDSVGDIDLGGDLMVGAGSVNGPNVRVTGSSTLGGSVEADPDGEIRLKNLIATGPTTLRAETIEVDGDIVAGAGMGMPHVRVFAGTTTNVTGKIGLADADMLNLSVLSGDLSADEIDLGGDLVVGPGTSASTTGANIRVFGSTTLGGNLTAFDELNSVNTDITLRNGVILTGSATLTGENINITEDIVAGVGSGTPNLTLAGTTIVSGTIGNPDTSDDRIGNLTTRQGKLTAEGIDIQGDLIVRADPVADLMNGLTTTNDGSISVDGDLVANAIINSAAAIDIGGISSIGADITSNGNQIFGGVVTLNENVTFKAGSGNILFESTLDEGASANASGVTFSTTGNVTFAEAVGSSTALDSLTFTEAKNIQFDKAVDIEGNLTITTANRVDINSTIEIGGDFLQSAGTGVTTFNGTTVTGIGGTLDVTTNEVQFNSAQVVTQGAVTVSADSSISTNGSGGIHAGTANISLTADEDGTVGVDGGGFMQSADSIIQTDGSITVQINGSGNARVANLNAGSSAGLVQITTGGAIVDSTSGENANVTGFAAALIAGAGIGATMVPGGNLNTAVSQLSFRNTSETAITNVENDGALTLIATGGFSESLAGAGGIIAARSPMTIAMTTNVTSGNMTFVAGNSASTSTADDLTIAANVTHTSGNGFLAFIAGDSILHNSGTINNTGGTVNEVRFLADNEGELMPTDDGFRGGITQATTASTARIVADRASFEAFEDITLNNFQMSSQTNSIGTVAANVTGDGNDFSLTNSTDLTIGTVLSANSTMSTPVDVIGMTTNEGNVSINNGTSAITIGSMMGITSGEEDIIAGSGTVTLTADGVTERSGSIISAANLDLNGTGTGDFDFSQLNMVGKIAANITGNLIFQDSDGLTIGTVTNTGIATGGGNVTLTTGGTLTLGDSATANINAGAGDVSFDASDGVREENSSGIQATGLELVGSGDFDLTGNNQIREIAGNITGNLTFNNESNLLLTVGEVGDSQGLTINSSAMSLNSIETLGAFTLDEQLDSEGSNVSLTANGAISQSANGIITADILGILQNNAGSTPLDVDLCLDNMVGTLSGGNMSAGGAFLFHNDGTLSVGGSGTPTGIETNNGDIQVTSTGAMTVNGVIQSTAGVTDPTDGNILLSSGGAVDLNAIVNAGQAELILNSGGSVDLDGIVTADTLRIISQGDVNQTATFTVNTLGIRQENMSVDDIDIVLNLANNFSTLAANNASDGGTIEATSALTVTVGTVAALPMSGKAPAFTQTAGISSTNGDVAITTTSIGGLNIGNGNANEGISVGDANVTLDSAGAVQIGDGAGQDISAGSGTVSIEAANGVTEATGSTINATNLELLGSGNFTLDQANSIGELAADINGELLFRNSQTLTIGTAGGTNGITTSDDTVSIMTTSGDISIGSNTANADQDITIGNSNLTIVSAGAVNIGDGAGQIIQAGSGTVSINASGDVTEAANSTITASNLELLGSGAFELEQANDVDVIAANVDGDFSFTNAATLTIGTSGGTDGITTAGDDVRVEVTGIGNQLLIGNSSDDQSIVTNDGNITLISTGQLTIGTATNGQSLDAQDGIVLINSAGVEEELGSTITASGLELLGTGTFNLAQMNDVDTLAANIDGSLSFVNTGALIVGTVDGDDGIAANGSSGITTGGSAVVIDAGLTTDETLTVNEEINTEAGTGGEVSVNSIELNAALVAGAGNITLNGGGCHLIINADQSTVTSATYQANCDIIIGAMVSTTGAAANLTLTADADDDGVGGVLIQTAGAVTATGNITVEGSDLTTTAMPGVIDAVFIEADAGNTQIDADGALTIQSNATTDIDGDVIVQGDINSDAGPLNITANRDVVIAANVTTGAGDMTIIAGNNMGPTGGVHVTSTGFINSAGAVNLTGSDLTTSTGIADSVRIAADGINNQVEAVGNITITSHAVKTPPTADVILAGQLQSDSGNIDITATQNILLSTSVTASGGNVDINSATVLDGDSSITSSGTTTFDATINDDGSGVTSSELTVSAADTTRFNAAIGNIAAIDRLIVNNGGTTEVNGNINVSGTTDGDIQFDDAVVLTNSVSMTSMMGDLLFNNTLDANTAQMEELTLNAAMGDILFAGNVGTTELGGLTISDVQNVDSNGNIRSEFITQTTGSGTTSFNGAITTSSATGINLTGNAFTFGDSTGVDNVTTTGMGTVTINNSGQLTINDNANFGLSGGFTQLGGGEVSLGADISTTDGDVSFTDNIELTDNVSLTSSNSSVLFNSTVDSTAMENNTLTVSATNQILFANNVGQATNGALGGIILDNATNIDFDQDVSLAGTLDIDTGTNGTVDFAGTVTTISGGNVTITNDGVLTLADAAVFNLDGSFTQDGNGTVTTGADITTNLGNVSFDSAVTLTDDVSITSNSGDVLFNSTVDSAATEQNRLTVSAPGQVLFAGNVGLMMDGELGGLTIDDATDIALNADVTLAGNLDIDTGVNGTVDINGTIKTTNGGEVEITNDGLLTLANTSSFNLVGAFSQDGEGDVSTGANITTTGDNVSFAEEVRLTADVAIDTGAGVAGDITFTKDVSGAFALTLAAGIGSVALSTVGAMTSVTGLTASSSANTTLNGDVKSAENGNVAITHSGLLSIDNNATLTLGGSFTEGGGGSVSTGADIMTTADDVTFNSATTLTDSIAISTGTGLGSITFMETLNASTVGTQGLTLEAGTGDILFNAAVGTTELEQLTITSATDVTANRSVAAGTITQSDGSGTTTFHSTVNTSQLGGIDLAGTNFSFNDEVTTTNGGTVTIENAGVLDIAGDADFDLTGAFLQTSGGTGTVQTAGDITTNGQSITFTDAVTLTDDGLVTFDTTDANGSPDGANIEFLLTLDGDDNCDDSLTFNAGNVGNITFTGTVGNTEPLGDILIQNANNVTVMNSLAANSLQQAAGQGTTLFSGNVSTKSDAGVDINSNVIDVDANVNVDSAANGTLHLNSTQGDITVDGNLTSDDGSMTLISADSIALNGTLTTDTGPVSITAVDDITLSGSTFVDSNSGTVSLTADSNSGDAVTGGVITMADGALIDAGSATITLSADGQISLGGLKTTNNTAAAVSVTSKSANIVDAGDANTDIEANAAGAIVTLNAATGIGTGDALDTEIDQLRATNAAGDITINEADALTVLNATTTVGSINISSVGTLTVDNTGAMTNAVSTTEAGDITLAATGSGSNVNINDGVAAAMGMLTIQADQSVIFEADGDVTTSTGNILVEAEGGMLTMVDGTIISSTSGTITLEAAGHVTLGELATGSTADDAVNITTTATVQSADSDLVNVTANSGRLNIQSATGVDTVRTQVDSLDIVNSTSGAIVINEEDSIDVVRIDQQSTVGVNEQIELTTTDGSINVVAEESGITATATSDITLTANGTTSDLNVASVVSTEGGDVALTTERNVSLTTDETAVASDGNVTSNGGNISITAGGTFTQDDQLTIDASAAFAVNSGTIDITAEGDVAIANVVTTHETAAAVMITSNNGAIIDNGDTNLDIEANSANAVVTLNAESGIGVTAPNGALETNISNLKATVDATGGIDITESDSLTIQQALTMDGSINFNAGGSLTVNDGGAAGDAVSAGNAGTVRLATDADLIINSEVVTTNASIQLLADNDISFSNNAADNGNVSSNGGNITITADTDMTGGGAITQEDGLSINAGTGQISIQAEDDITLANVTTTNTGPSALFIQSDAGSLLDGGETNVDLVANTGAAVTTIRTATGVGVSANPLETSLITLDINNTTSGEIQIRETDELTIRNLQQNGAGLTDIRSDGTLTIDNGTGTGNAIVSNGTASVRLESTGMNSDVQINDGISTTTGNIELIASGDGSDVNVNGDVSTTGGDMIMTAANAVSTTLGDDITTIGQAGVDSGNVVITANSGGIDIAGNITTTANATENAGDVTIQADGTADINISGNITADATDNAATASVTIKNNNSGDLLITGDISAQSTNSDGGAVLLETEDGSIEVNNVNVSAGNDAGTMTAVAGTTGSTANVTLNGMLTALGTMADGSVSLTAAGDIIDGRVSNETTQIFTGNLSLSAGTNIGEITDFVARTGNAIDAQVSGLLLDLSTTNSGEIHLNIDGDLQAATGAIEPAENEIGTLLIQTTGALDVGTIADALILSTGDLVGLHAGTVLTLPDTGMSVGTGVNGGTLRLSATDIVDPSGRDLGKLTAQNLFFTSDSTGGDTTINVDVDHLDIDLSGNTTDANLTINNDDAGNIDQDMFVDRIVTSGGNLEINNGSELEINSVATNGGSVLINNGNSLTITSIVSTSLDSSDGEVRINNSLAAGGGDISIDLINARTGNVILDTTANGGQLRDLNAANTNIIAAGLATRTANITSVNVTDQTLEVQVVTFAASADNLGVKLFDETGDLEIGTVDGLNGIIVTNADADDIIEVVTVGGLNITQDISSDGLADIFLASRGSAEENDINLDAVISKTGSDGDVHLVAGDDVTMTSKSQITAANDSNVTVQAGVDIDGPDSSGTFVNGNADADILMSDASLISTVSGTLTLNAANDVAISILDAGDGNVVVTADDSGLGGTSTNQMGEIRETLTQTTATGEAANIIADDASLTAATGIGSSDDIELNAKTVDATNSTSGNIQLFEVVGTGDNDLTVNSISNMQGNIDVQTGDGSLTIAGEVSTTDSASGEGTVNIVAGDDDGDGNGDLFVQAAITTEDGSVTLTSDGNNVEFNDDGDLTTTSGRVDVTAGLTDDSGSIIQTAGSVMNSGDDEVTLTANGQITLGQIITTNSSDQAVSLNADAGINSSDPGNHLNIDAAAGRLVINTGTGVEPIRTTVDSLDLSNMTSGGVTITETDALDIIKVDQNANAGIDLTSGGTMTLVAGEAGVTGTDSPINLTTIKSVVDEPADIVINSTVQSSDGKITINAAENLEMSAAAAIQTQAEELLLVAGDALNGASTTDGSILMANGAEIIGNNASTDLVADQNIQVGKITTSTDIRLTSLEGGISDSGDMNGVNLTATNLGLDAATGIGSGNALETSVQLLAAENSTSGAIQVDNTGVRQLTIGTFNQSPESPGLGTIVGVTNVGNDSGQIGITNIGAITVNDVVTNSSGGDINLTATADGANDDHLVINAQVSTAGAGGNISLNGGTDIDVNARIVAQVDDVQAEPDGLAGNVTLVAGRSIIVDAQVGATASDLDMGGNIVMTAQMGDIDVNAPITTPSSSTLESGNITLDAAGAITIDAQVTASALTQVDPVDPADRTDVPIPNPNTSGNIVFNAGTDITISDTGETFDIDGNTITGTAGGNVTFGTDVIARSATGSIIAPTPSLTNVVTPQVTATGIAVIMGDFGRDLENTFVYEIVWQAGDGDTFSSGQVVTYVTPGMSPVNAPGVAAGSFIFDNMYFGNPDPLNPASPIPITITLFDDPNIFFSSAGEELGVVSTTSLAEVPGEGLAAAAVFDVSIEVPPLEAPRIVFTDSFETESDELGDDEVEVVLEGTIESEASRDELILIIQKIGPDGKVERDQFGRPIQRTLYGGDAIELLTDLPDLHDRLDSGHWKIFTKEGEDGQMMLVEDVFLRDGKPVVGDEGTQDRPPTSENNQSTPSDNLEEPLKGNGETSQIQEKKLAPEFDSSEDTPALTQQKNKLGMLALLPISSVSMRRLLKKTEKMKHLAGILIGILR